MQLLPFWSFSNFNPGKPVNKEIANENPTNNPNRFWPLFIDVVVWDRWLFFVQRLRPQLILGVRLNIARLALNLVQNDALILEIFGIRPQLIHWVRLNIARLARNLVQNGALILEIFGIRLKKKLVPPGSFEFWCQF